MSGFSGSPRVSKRGLVPSSALGGAPGHRAAIQPFKVGKSKSYLWTNMPAGHYRFSVYKRTGPTLHGVGKVKILVTQRQRQILTNVRDLLLVVVALNNTSRSLPAGPDQLEQPAREVCL